MTRVVGQQHTLLALQAMFFRSAMSSEDNLSLTYSLDLSISPKLINYKTTKSCAEKLKVQCSISTEPLLHYARVQHGGIDNIGIHPLLVRCARLLGGSAEALSAHG